MLTLLFFSALFFEPSARAADPRPVVLTIRNADVNVRDRWLGRSGFKRLGEFVDQVAPTARLLHIETNDLEEVEGAALARLNDGEVVVGFCLFGHGDAQSYALDGGTDFGGEDMASFVHDWLSALPTSPKVYLHFLSCSLGAVSADGSGFAEQLAEGLRDQPKRVHVLTSPFASTTKTLEPLSAWHRSMVSRIKASNFRRVRPFLDNNVVAVGLLILVWIEEGARVGIVGYHGGDVGGAVTHAVYTLAIADGLTLSYVALTAFKYRIIRELIAGNGRVDSVELAPAHPRLAAALRAAIDSAGCQAALRFKD